MLSESSGTRLGVPIATSNGTATMRGGCSATIIPNCRSATSRTAAAPNRSARSRSKVEGRRTAAALQMAQHERPRLLTGHLLDRMRDLVADPAEQMTGKETRSLVLG